jgi:hypothetical protein
MKNKTGGGRGTNQYRIKGKSVAKSGEKGDIKGGRAKDKTNQKKVKDTYKFTPPYTVKEYNSSYENSFGNDGFFKINKIKPIFSNGKIKLPEIDVSNIKPQNNIKMAVKQYRTNFPFYIKSAVEIEGFATTDFEILEMFSTDDLRNLLTGNDKRTAVVAGITEGFKQVCKAIETNKKLDANFYKNLNRSFAYASLKNYAGYLRGEKKPFLSVYVPLKDNKAFIPVLPVYSYNNLLQDLETKIKNNSNNLSNILKLESMLTYGQYFPDGNIRCSKFFTDALLLKKGYLPPIIEQWNRGRWQRTKMNLYANGDATNRVKLLADMIRGEWDD